MTTPSLPPEVLDAINAEFPDVLEVKRRARINSIVITVEGRARTVTGDQFQLGGTQVQVQCVDIDPDQETNSHRACFGVLANGFAASKRVRVGNQYLWVATAFGQSPRVITEADGMAMMNAARNRAIADALAAIDCN
ncbi:hypothetical protein [Caballeronia sp. ATUFL_M2_KS44]|uniref:hypothetical protein n=1 Tax=Caballeronia sp. ATUFL_M2_KS44 TaxID=2921767 RepID=UPI0020287BAC|nr:hypothetical protein [Caballeronia sp. ATUFL_M2_KS44]